jgi:formiminotetrahydrofolate cyclodeaminase
MATKLTLTIDRSIIERAKSYAKNTGRSLSELIENYLETITQESVEEKLSPKLNKIVGSVKLPKNYDQEKELRNYFESKHL